jgi:membrane fusion protein (multidrug efflux system)
MNTKSLKTTANSLFFSSIFAATLVLSGCGGGGGVQAKEADKASVNAVPVEVATASLNAVNASYNGTATLVTDHEAQVASKTSGVLVKLLVEEGSVVHEGQLLAELDDATPLAAVAQAEAQMHKADATFAYAEQSIQKQLISKREYDQANFDMQTQRAAVQTAKLQLAYTRIVAPVSGIVAERSVKLGNLVQVNQSLFRIVNMDTLQAVLNVPERQLGILKAGQTVALEADALPGQKFAGNILRIAPVVDPASGTFRVTCEFRDKTRTLKPGMFGRIDIVYDHRDDALTIPRSALIEEDGETAVFVVDAAPVKVPTADADKSDKSKDGDKAKVAAKDAAGKDAGKDGKAIVATTPGLVAHRKLVKIGYSDGDKVEIRSGLDAGTRVITVGRNAVRDGTAVQVLDTSTMVASRAGGDKA